MITKAENTDDLQEFCDDLRAPKVTFGRCGITGEWGKIVAIDLGDISIEIPDVDDGVEFDQDTKKVNFTKSKPVVLHNQALLSKPGLQRLMDFIDSQENPIPAVTPELVYKWQVNYTDGTALSQFITDSKNGEITESNSSEIDHSRVVQLSIVANFPELPRSADLPTYTFVKETGKFYCNGQEIDTTYEGSYQSDSELIYARKVSMTFGSAMKYNSMDRDIQNVHSSVLQLIGWKTGGLHGSGPGCIIAIDERGYWRPYEYIEG